MHQLFSSSFWHAAVGYQRARDGWHDAQNRARVQDVLLALSRVEIRGERFHPDTRERELYSAPLMSMRGGRYHQEEARDISLADLLEQGLPSTLALELGWYDGVRRSDGKLGRNYVLLPRALAYFQGLGEAHHLATEDRVAEFLWLRYSLQHSQHPRLVLTLEVALRRAGVTNKSITRARDTLQKALQRLIERGQVENYTDLP